MGYESRRETMGFAATTWLRCIREAPRCIPCFAVEQPAAFFFGWAAAQSRDVRSAAAAQVPSSELGGCGCCCEGPRLRARRQIWPTGGSGCLETSQPGLRRGFTGAATPGRRQGGERASHNFGSPRSSEAPFYPKFSKFWVPKIQRNLFLSQILDPHHHQSLAAFKSLSVSNLLLL